MSERLTPQVLIQVSRHDDAALECLSDSSREYSISQQPANFGEDAISSPALVEYSLFAEKIADMGYKWLRRLGGDNCAATPGHILRRHLCGGNWFEGAFKRGINDKQSRSAVSPGN